MKNICNLICESDCGVSKILEEYRPNTLKEVVDLFNNKKVLQGVTATSLQDKVVLSNGIEITYRRLTKEEKKALEAMWFIWGNGGKLMKNLSYHKFIQQVLEFNDLDIDSLAKHYGISRISDIYKIIKGVIY